MYMYLHIHVYGPVFLSFSLSLLFPPSLPLSTLPHPHCPPLHHLTFDFHSIAPLVVIWLEQCIRTRLHHHVYVVNFYIDTKLSTYLSPWTKLWSDHIARK